MLSKPLIAKFTPKASAHSFALSRGTGARKHLTALSILGFEDFKVTTSLLGYCPGRPPKQGVIALMQDTFVFCHKTRLGGTVKQIQFSHISGFEISRFIKQHVIKIYSPALNFEFVTRMPETDVQSFILELKSTLKYNSNFSTN